MTENIRHLKRDLRHTLKNRLTTEAPNPGAPAALRDRFLAGIKLPPTAIIAAYIATDHEIDPAPLLDALHKQGHKLALPVIRDKNQPLAFYRFAPGDALTPGSHGIPEPAEMIVVEPDIVLVPLLGFDKNGHRLGRGAGHYDRTLTNLRVQRKILAIGLAFSMQQVPIIPADSHDARLDKVVTEIEVIPILNHS